MEMEKIYDLIVIGAGPAGISAALYAKRAKLDVAVLFKDTGSLLKAEKIENYYGLAQPVSGERLFKNGLEQAAALGIELVEAEVLRLVWDGMFQIETKTGFYNARAAVIATGAARKTLPIPGLAEYEGKGVSYCAVCDAFFYRDKDVGVLGDGAFAYSEALHLKPVVRSVTILTNGKPPAFQNGEGFAVVEAPVTKINGGATLAGLTLGDGGELALSGLFVALGTAGAADFARAAGAATENGRILVDSAMQTTIPGLYAAGDCVGGILQASVAVGEGARAAMAAIEHVRELKKKEAANE